MGGSLTLWAGAEHPDVDGLICVNPATLPQPPEVMEMIDEALADGTEVMPGIGSDIADPDAVEIAYDGTPTAAAGVVHQRRSRCRSLIATGR